MFGNVLTAEAGYTAEEGIHFEILFLFQSLFLNERLKRRSLAAWTPGDGRCATALVAHQSAAPVECECNRMNLADCTLQLCAVGLVLQQKSVCWWCWWKLGGGGYVTSAALPRGATFTTPTARPPWDAPAFILSRCQSSPVSVTALLKLTKLYAVRIT